MASSRRYTGPVSAPSNTLSNLGAVLAANYQNLQIVNERIGSSLWSGENNGRRFAIRCFPNWGLTPQDRDVLKSRFAEVRKLELSSLPKPLRMLDCEDHLIFVENWAGSWPWSEVARSREAALDSAIELFDSLDALHSKGLVHGDLHSGRLAVGEADGRFKLFGFLSRVPDPFVTVDRELECGVELLASFLSPSEYKDVSSLRSAREISKRLKHFLGKLAYDISEPELIGRDRFLAQMDRALSKGGLLAVTGSAGSGKTRLLQEWSKTSSARILRGKAAKEVAPSPFQLFLEPFAQLETELAAEPVLLHSLSDELEFSIPILDSLTRTGNFQLGVLVRLGQLLERLNEHRTTVLILEDVHWADDFTLNFLKYWSEVPGRPLVIVTFRSDELESGHFLHTVSESKLELPELTEVQAERLLRSAQPSASNTAIESAVRRGQGNPFLLLQFLRSGTLEGNFHQVRVASLALSTRRSLAMAAVWGDEFTAEQISQFSDEKPDFQAAVKQGIIAESGESFRFSHDRLREACLALLPLDELCATHERIADFLSQGSAPNPFRVAYHYLIGGKPHRGVRFARQAGEKALLSHDLNTAAYYFQATLLGLDSDSTELAEVNYQLGHCLRLIGRYSESEKYLELALSDGLNSDQKAKILLALADVHFKQANLERAKQVLVDALSLVGERQPMFLPLALCGQVFLLVLRTLWARRGRADQRDRTLLIASLYNRLAYVNWFLEGPIDSIWAHLCELNLAERYGKSCELAKAQANHAMAMSAIPWWSRALAYGKKALETARAVGDKATMGQVSHFYGAALLGACRLKEARSTLLEARKLLQETGDRWEENGVCYHLALVYYRQGALDKATELARQTQQTGIEINDRLAAGDNLYTWARSRQGRISKDSINAENRFSSPDLQRAAELLCAEALVDLRMGHFEAALENFAAAWAKYQTKRVQNLYAASIPCWAATASRLVAQTSALERREKGLKQAKSWSGLALKQARKYRTNLPHALREKGLIALAEGNYKVATDSLLESIAEARSSGQTHEVRLSASVLAHFRLLLGDTHLSVHADKLACQWLLGQAGMWEDHLSIDLQRLLGAASQISQCYSTPTALYQLCEGCRSLLGRAKVQCAILSTEPTKNEQLGGDFGISLPSPPYADQGWTSFVLRDSNRPMVLILRRGESVVSEQEKMLLKFLVDLTETVIDRATRTESTISLSQDLQESTDRLGFEASRLVRAREQLLVSEKLAITGRLAAGLVHDLRNLTLAINATAEMLLIDLEAECTESPELRDILSAGRKSGQLLTQLSQIAQGDVVGEQLVDVNGRLADTTALLRSLCGPMIKLDFELQESVSARIDPMTLDRIVLNLVMNARDAVASGGQICVSAGSVKVDKRREGFPCDVPVGHYTLLSVADDGVGISEEILPQIFELHFTTKGSSGTGVGLATVLEMVERAGGFLVVESESGGTVFDIYLRPG